MTLLSRLQPALQSSQLLMQKKPSWANQSLIRLWSDFDQALIRLWSGTDQTYWSNARKTDWRHQFIGHLISAWSDFDQALIRHWSDTDQMSEKLIGDISLSDSWSVPDQTFSLGKKGDFLWRADFFSHNQICKSLRLLYFDHNHLTGSYHYRFGWGPVPKRSLNFLGKFWPSKMFLTCWREKKEKGYAVTQG